MPVDASYWDYKCIQAEFWGAIRSLRPHRPRDPPSLESMVGTSAFAIFWVYSMLFRRIWLKRRYSSRQECQRGIDGEIHTESPDNLNEDLQVSDEFHHEPIVVSPSSNAADLVDGKFSQSERTHVNDDQESVRMSQPNTFSTPERSLNIQLPSSLEGHTQPRALESSFKSTSSVSPKTPFPRQRLDKASLNQGLASHHSLPLVRELSAKIEALELEMQRSMSPPDIAILQEELELTQQALHTLHDETTLSEGNIYSDLAGKIHGLMEVLNKQADELSTTETILRRPENASAQGLRSSEEASPETSRPPPRALGSESSVNRKSSIDGPLSPDRGDKDSDAEEANEFLQSSYSSLPKSHSTGKLTVSNDYMGGLAQIPAFRSIPSVENPSTAVTPPLATTKATLGYRELVQEVQRLTQSMQRSSPEASSPSLDHIHTLQTTLTERSAECTSLRARVERLTRSLQQSEDSQFQSKQKEASLTAQLKFLQAAHEASEKRFQKQLEECKKLDAQNQKLSQAAEVHAKEFSAVKQKTQGRLEEYMSAVEELRATYQEQIKQLRTNLATKEDDCVDLTARKERTASELDGMSAHIQQLEAQLQSKEQEWSQNVKAVQNRLLEQAKIHEKETLAKENQYNELLSSVAALSSELSKSREELKNTKESSSMGKESLLLQIRMLEKRLNEQKTEHEIILQKEVPQQTQVMAAPEEDSKPLFDSKERCKDLQTKLKTKENEYTSRLQTLESQLAMEIQKQQSSHDTIQKLNQDLSKTKDKLTHLQREMQSKEERHQIDISTLHQKLRERQEAEESIREEKYILSNSLSAKLEDLTRTIEDRNKELAHVQNDARTKEVVLTAEIESLQTELQCSARRKDEALADAENRCAQLRDEVKQITEKFNSLSYEHVEEKGRLTEQIKNLLIQREEKEKSHQARITENENIVSSLKQKVAELSRAVEGHEEQMSRLSSESEDRVNELASQICSFHNSLDEKEAILNEKDNDLKSAFSQIKVLQQENQSLTDELTLLESAPRRHDLLLQIHQLTNELSIANEQLGALQEEKTQLESKLRAKEIQHDQCMQDMDRHCQQLNATIERQSQKVDEQAKEIESWKVKTSDRERLLSERLDATESELSTRWRLYEEQQSEAEEKCSELSTMVEVLTMELKTCSEESNLLQDQLNKKEKEWPGISAKLEEAEQLNGAVHTLTQNLDHATQEKLAAEASNADLEMQLRNARLSIKRLQTSLNDMETRERALQEQGEQMKEKYSAVREKAFETEQELHETRLKLASLEDEVKNLREMRSEMYEAKGNLESSLGEAEVFSEKLQTKISYLEAVNKVSQDSILGLTTELRELKKSDSKNVESLEATRVDLKDCQQDLLQTKKDLTLEAKNCADLRSKFYQMRKTNESLESRAALAENSLSEKNEKLASKESACLSLETSLQEANKKLQVFETLVGQLKKENEDEKNTNIELNQAWEQADSKSANLERALARKETVLQQVLGEKKALAQALQAQKAAAQQLEESTASRLASLESDLKRSQALKEEAEKARSNTNDSMKDLETKMIDIDKALQRKETVVQRVMEEKEELHQKLQSSTSSDRESNEKLTSLQEEFKKLTQQLQLAKESNQSLQTTLKDSESTAGKMRAKASKLESALAFQLGETDALSQKLSGFKSELSELKSAAATTDTQLNEAKAQLEKSWQRETVLKMSLNDKDKLSMDLRDKVDVLSQKLNACEKQGSDNEQLLKDKSDFCSELEGELKEKSKDLDVLRKSDGQLRDARERNDTLESELENLRHEKAEAEKAKEDLEKILGQVGSKIKGLEEALSPKRAVIQGVFDERKTLVQDMDALMSSLKDLQLATAKLPQVEAKLQCSEQEKQELLIVKKRMEESQRASEVKIKELEDVIARKEDVVRSLFEEKKDLSRNSEKLKEAESKARTLAKVNAEKIAELETNLASTTHQINELDLASRTQDNEVESLRQKLSDKEAANTELVGEVQSARLKIENLNTDLKKAESLVSNLEDQARDLEEANKSQLDYVAHSISISDELSQMKASNEDYLVQLNEAAKRLSAMEGELKQTRNMENIKSGAKFSAAVSEMEVHKNRAAAAERELENQKRSYQSTLDEIEKHFKDLSTKVEVVSEKLQQKEMQLKQFEKTSKEKQEKSNAHVKDLQKIVEQKDAELQARESLAERVKILENESEEKIAECELLKVTRQDAASRVEVLECDLRTKGIEHDRLTAQINATLRSLEEKTAECKCLNEKVETLTEELTSRNERLEVLENQQKALKNQLRVTETSSLELAEQLDQKSLECNELKNSMQQLEDKLQNKVSDQNDMNDSMDVLTQELREQQQLQEKVNVSMTRMIDAIETKTKECNKLQNEIDSLRHRLTDKTGLSSDNEGPGDELQVKHTQKDSMNETPVYTQHQLYAKKDEYDKLSKEVETLNETISGMREEAKSKGAELIDVKDESAAQKEQCEKLETLNQQLQNSWDETEEICEDLTSRRDALYENCKRYASDITMLEEERDISSVKVKRLENEVHKQKENYEKLRELNQELERELKEKEARCDDLRKQVESLSKTCFTRSEQITRLEDKLANKVHQPKGKAKEARFSKDEYERLLRQEEAKSAELHKKVQELEEGCQVHMEQISRLEQELSFNETPSDMEHLHKSLRQEKEKCTVLRGQVEALERGYKDRANTIQNLVEQSRSKEEESANKIDQLEEEITKRDEQREKMNESFEELLALWEAKEKQCFEFKVKLDNLAQKLEEREAHIEELKQKILQLETAGNQELVLYQNGPREDSQEVQEINSHKEVQLSSRLETLNTNIQQREKQLADLERSIREREEEASVAGSVVSTWTKGAMAAGTISSSEKAKRKSRIPRPKFLSSFKR